jgi:tetratricopeptide (TPR) repeat protein
VEEALTKLKVAAGIEPKNPIVLAWLGIALNASGDLAGAEDTLHRARILGAPDELALGPFLDAKLSLGENQAVLDLFPDPVPTDRGFSAGMILRARASALQTLGASARASDAINRSLVILHDFDGVMTAGRIALQQQNFANADARADEALRLRPADIGPVLLKIDVAMQKGEQANGIALVEKLVAAKPRSMAARLARIKVYLSAGLTAKAKPDVNLILAQKRDLLIARYFQAVIRARSNDVSGAWSIAHSLPTPYVLTEPGMALNVANMAVGAGFLESGAAILNAAVFRYPNLLDARLQLADVRLRQNSPQYALNVLALVEDSKDSRVAILFARAYLMKHDASNAQRYIERAIELGGGEGLRVLGKDVALKSLSDWLAKHPDNDQVQRQYAVVLSGFGDLAKARIEFEELVRGHPTDAFSLNNLAWLVVKDDPRRSLLLAQRAVKQTPTSPDYLDTLGCMQLSQSDFKGALASLQQAHQLRAADSEIAYHLALAFEANGDRAAALEILQAAVSEGKFRDVDAAKALLASWQKTRTRSVSGLKRK